MIYCLILSFLSIFFLVQELAQKCREVARMQRQLDDVPTQSELIQ
jgi:hypothetical protein